MDKKWTGIKDKLQILHNQAATNAMGPNHEVLAELTTVLMELVDVASDHDAMKNKK